VRPSTDPHTKSARAAAPPRPQRQAWIAALALVGITVLAYVPALNAGYVWDDDTYVTENQALRTVDGLRRIWAEPGAVVQYYPMTFTSFWLDYQLFGDAARGYHLVNVLLHAANSLLVWHLLVLLGWRGAWLAGALFALHPLHVESVAWITERKNVLSALFYLTSIWAYLRYEALSAPTSAPTSRTAAATSRNRRSWYAASLVLFGFALLSKTVTCTLPVALLIVTYWQRGRFEGKVVAALAPFGALSLGLALMTIEMERHHVGAVGADWMLSLVDRGLLAGRALWFYAAKLLYPYPLVFIYPRWTISSAESWQYVFPAGVLLVLATLFRLRTSIGRGPLCALLYFVVALAPVLGFIDFYLMRFSFVADHFCYLASIGPLGLAAAALQPSGRLAPASRIVAGAVLLLLGILTWNRSQVYADEMTLWRDTAARNPAAWIAHNNIGANLLQGGHRHEAVEELELALQLRPDLDDAHNNLGVVALSQGQLDAALHHFSEAVRITAEFGAALVNLASTLQMKGRNEEAIQRYQQALRARPLDSQVRQILPKVYTNLGMAFEATGKPAAAISSYEQALRLAPDLAAVRDKLAVLRQSR
jgi:tetratricopeptide (TPR) repeat protein